MKKTLFLIFIILILLILSIFSFFLIRANKENSADDLKIENTLETSSNTQPSTLPPTSTSNTLNPTQNQTPQDINLISEELKYQTQTKELLKQWKETENKIHLEQALLIINNTDNEAIRESWIDILSTETLEVFTALSSDQNNLYMLYVQLHWFIFATKSYDQLTNVQKQEITNIFNRLKDTFGEI